MVAPSLSPLGLLATYLLLAAPATAKPVALPSSTSSLESTNTSTDALSGWPAAPTTTARGENQLPRDYNPYQGGQAAAQLRYPGGYSRNINRLKVHSHNDYTRDVPLFSALSRGISSVEADVWLNPLDDTLYVSHRRPLVMWLSPLIYALRSLVFFLLPPYSTAQVSHAVAALTKARTFQGLYVDPLVKLLEAANPADGEAAFFNTTDLFSSDNQVEERAAWTGYWGNDEPINFLVDLKTRGDATYEAVKRELEPLRSRGWLTKWDGEKIVPGPIRVVLSGNGNNLDVRRAIGALNETDIFIDAPLLSLSETWLDADGNNQTWTPRISPLTSASFAIATQWDAKQPITDDQFARMHGLLQAARDRGFETRLWSPPRWPTFARDRAWRALLDAGVDWLDADDLDAVLAL